MLTRRRFAGIASCAICTAAGFIATDAAAQGDGVTRTTLSQMDGPTPGYVTIIMQVDLAPNASLPRHTHPGIESGYVAEGGVEVKAWRCLAGRARDAPRSQERGQADQVRDHLYCRERETARFPCPRMTFVADIQFAADERSHKLSY
jgi:hypothetical protein